MAYTDKLKSTRVYIAMGDGATPETFATFCGINTKGLQQTPRDLGYDRLGLCRPGCYPDQSAVLACCIGRC